MRDLNVLTAVKETAPGLRCGVFINEQRIGRIVKGINAGMCLEISGGDEISVDEVDRGDVKIAEAGRFDEGPIRLEKVDAER
jgi:alanine-alpha-ketoisovalerate/valine-pyruvate aminotransferase